MSVLKKQALEQHGKSRLTQPTGLSLPTDFLTRSSSRMLDNAAPTTCQPLMSSQEVSLAKISVSQVPGRRTKISVGCAANEAVYFGRSYASSKTYNLAGWSLKMSLTCSLSTIAKTLKQSSGRLRTAGMWDSGECLMLSISESPSSVVAFSWSPVIDECPPSSCWLTPHQWTQYLQRLARSPGHVRRIAGLPILCWQQKRDLKSLWAVQLSSLTRTHGIRWLSGSERLQMMGFAGDWMRPTLRRLSLPEMPSLRKSRNGSPGS